MGGIHLINHFEWGVTIQFYVLLIVALLELNLKQQTISQQEEDESDPNNQIGQDETDPDDLSPSNNDTGKSSDKTISHPYQFFQIIGDKLKKYWKIGIHWLTALRSILHLPFNDQVVKILGTT